MKTIDLRSDTVTKPTTGMMEAMMSAKVGDDVFGEDPSINALEEKLAHLFGLERGLFCPSGTMTNQIGIKIHTQPGDELICDQSSHIYNYEGGGIAFNSGVQAKLLQGDRGRLNVNQIREAINPKQDWLTKTSLVCLENTVNRSGGSFYALKDLQEISTFCKEKDLRLHLDGARIFNALVETKDPASVIGPLFDSISICLSKGLGCPVGSVLLGSSKLIAQAKRVRKVFGGGMRQAGFLAAAGIYALDNHINRLVEDHQKAKDLAETLEKLPWIKSILPVETNIVIFNLTDSYTSEIIASKLKTEGVVASPFGGKTMRMVTHLDLSQEDIERVKSVFEKLEP
jgi:threonine aldolase